MRSTLSLRRLQQSALRKLMLDLMKFAIKRQLDGNITFYGGDAAFGILSWEADCDRALHFYTREEADSALNKLLRQDVLGLFNLVQNTGD